MNMPGAEHDGEATAAESEEEAAQSDVPGAAAAEKRGDEESQSDVKTDVNGEAVSELDEPSSFEEGVCGGASPATGLLQLLLGEEEQVGAGSHAFHTDRLSASCFAVELHSASHTDHPRFPPSPPETLRSLQ